MRTPISPCRFVGVFVVLSGALAAQAQFSDVRKLDWPGGDGTALVLEDLNGDGHADVMLARRGQNRLFLGVGKASFVDVTTTALPVDNDWALAVAAGDVDGDGDLDLLLGNSVAQNRLLLNDGAARFTDVTSTHLPGDSGRTEDVALADVDGDGDLDAFFGRFPQRQTSQANKLYLNDGTGHFADVSATHLPVNRDIFVDADFADVDGDGDADLLLAGAFGTDRIYINDGTGRFTDETATRLSTGSYNTDCVAAGDVDGDGDLDLAWGGRAAGRLMLNDGTGVFQLVPGFQFSGVGSSDSDVEFADIDRDGDLDLVVAFYQTAREPEVYLNNGTGGFQLSPGALPLGREYVEDFALGDLNGDGSLDVVLVGEARSGVFENGGAGRFTELPRSSPRGPFHANTNTPQAAFADTDGDGDLDVVLAEQYAPPEQNRHFRNDGRGNYTDATAQTLPAFADATLGVALGDANGDGAVDVAFANVGQNRLLLNDGTGRFVEATGQLPADADASQTVAFADVDGDLDLDLVFANDGQDRLYLNDGTGNFTDATARLPAATTPSRDVVVFDIDADGDLDLFFAKGVFFYYGTPGAQNVLYLNDGTGTFTDVTATRLPVDTDVTATAVAGDVDADGDIDLVLGNESQFCNKYGCWGAQDRLYLNDGTGHFTDATAVALPAAMDHTTAIALGDLDGDGDLDLISTPNRLYLNDGSGSFANASGRLPTGMAGSSDVQLVDADDDGDLDVFYADFDRLFVNLLRHTHAPRLPRVGVPYEIAFYAEPGFASQPGAAVLLLGAAPARIPLPPFGVLGLAPGLIVALPQVAIPAPAGTAATSLAIPAVGNLIGATLFAQSALLQPGRLRLTNTIDDVIR